MITPPTHFFEFEYFAAPQDVFRPRARFFPRPRAVRRAHGVGVGARGADALRPSALALAPAETAVASGGFARGSELQRDETAVRVVVAPAVARATAGGQPTYPPLPPLPISNPYLTHI